MKIQINNLFKTPDKLEEIGEWIELQSPDEKIHLYTAMMMTWNFLAKELDKENDEQNDEIREAIRRIYCMNVSDFIDLMEFNDDNYAIEKFLQVQRNPTMALVDSLDENHSNKLLDWAMRK
ncbi:MAG: hypothetical protein DRI65_18145, partial [Chloroflexota bacterium]